MTGVVPSEGDRPTDGAAGAGDRPAVRPWPALAAGTASAIVTTDLLGNATARQPGWERLTGQLWPVYRGQGWLDAVHEDDRGALREGLALDVAPEPVVHHEARVRCADGTWRRFGVTRVLRHDDGGALNGLLWALRDVGAERAAAEARDAAHRADGADARRLRALLRGTSWLVWRADAAGNFVPNPAWERLTGQPLREAAHGGWLERVHPDDRERAIAWWERVRREGVRDELELRVRTASGKERHVSARAAPVTDAGGRVTEWIGTLTDVTDRKLVELERAAMLAVEREARERVERAARRWEAMLAAYPREVWIGDPQGQLRSSFAGWTELTGQDVGKGAGFGWVAMVHPEDREDTVLRWRRSLEHGVPFEAVYRVRDAAGDGWRVAFSRAYPVRDEDGTVMEWIGSIADVTGALEPRRRVRETREEGRRLAGQLVAGRDEQRRRLARTLRADLAALDVPELLARIHDLADELHPAVLERDGLPAALRALAERVGREAQMRIHVDVDPRAARVREDAQLHLYRVAEEALRNVVRHAGVTEAWLTLVPTAHSVRLRVRDAGRGFDAEHATGRGVGLVTMELRAYLAGGVLTVSSEPGVGTVVTMEVARAMEG